MDSPLTTHHDWRNSPPQSRSDALETVLPPAIGVDLGTPRKRPGDPHREQIFVLGKSISSGHKYLLLLTYLGRSLDTELLQSRKSDRHVMEQLCHCVVILHS